MTSISELLGFLQTPSVKTMILVLSLSKMILVVTAKETAFLVRVFKI